MNKFCIILCAILKSYCFISGDTIGEESVEANFEALTKCSTFVDKTSMIDVFFNYSKSWKYHLLTCPRKFGKSINMDMMKRFVQIEVDDVGKVKEKETTTNYKLFVNNSLTLKISQSNSTINAHLAEYPIIYLELYGIVEHTFEQTLANLGKKIKKCFEMYFWLYEIFTAEGLEKKKSTHIENVKFMKRVLYEELNSADIESSLITLSKILHEYFQKKIFVFIDNYDSPLIDAAGKDVGYDMNLIYKLLIEMYQKLLKTPRNNVEYVFITGITNTMLPLLTLKSKKIHHHRFLSDHIFSQYYGLTQEEVDDLLTRRECDAKTTKSIPNYFKGYLVSGTMLELYNTYTITKYLREFKPNVSFPAYWVESGSIDFLQNFTQNDDVYDKISHLVLLKEVKFRLLPYLSIDDLKILFGKKNDDTKPINVHVIFTYLFESGYLSYTELPEIFKIPNEEVETAFSNYLFDFYGKNLGPEAESIGEELKRVLDCLHVNKKMLIKLKTLLQNLIPKAESLISKHVEKEFHYHSLIYYSAKKFHKSTGAEVRMLCEDSKTAANTRKIKRRADIVMVNENKTVMMIIEIKSNCTAKHALEVAQMYKPVEEMEKPKILKYLGINFKRNVTEVGYNYEVVRDTAVFVNN